MKRTKPLRRKPIQRHHPGRPVDSRAQVYHRAHGRCELCGSAIERGHFEEHHVFFKSHVSALVVNESWNRSCVHQRCHERAHSDREARERLEEIAIGRLRHRLSPQIWALLLSRRKGTSAAATVRAYESYRGDSFRHGDTIKVLDVQNEPQMEDAG